MCSLHRLRGLFVSPPPLLAFLMGVVLGGVLTSTFTFQFWWCSYSETTWLESMQFVRFRNLLTNSPLTNGSFSPSECVCGAELQKFRNFLLPAISKAPGLESSESLSIQTLNRGSNFDNDFEDLDPKINNLPTRSSKSTSSDDEETLQYLGHEFQVRKQLLVAVVTSSTHLQTASMVYNTWGAEVPQILFFVGKNCCNVSTNPYIREMPLIRLPNVPDLPINSVAKHFSVIKYISDNYGSRFQWFLLANDNLYARAARLASLLKQLDPSEDIYLGRGARGKDKDARKLSLLPHELYCLGSSGVVLSQRLLQRLVPHLELCLNAAVSGKGQDSSGHPDVKLGRCISLHIGVQCSRAAQAKSFFFADYSSQPLTSRYLSKTNHFHDLITYHPVPSPEAMLQIHYHYKQIEFKQSIEKAKIAQEDLKLVCKAITSYEKSEIPDKDCEVAVCPCQNDSTVQARCPSMGVVTELSSRYQPTTIYDIQAWQYFNNHFIYSDTTIQPSYRLTSQKNTRRELQEMLDKVVQAASEKYGQELRFKEIVNGWVRHNPSRGSEYIVDCLFVDGFQTTVARRINFVRPLATNYITQKDSGDAQATVAFVVPMANVNERFREFIAMYENLGLASKENVKLILAVYGKDDISFVNKILEPVRDKYPEASVTVVEGKGEFSRGKALHLGMSKLYPEELAFFCDVDMTISKPFLEKCRKNTIRGKRVYYPEVFALYNLDYVYHEKKHPSRIFIERTNGHWVYYGYGMLCIYKSDYDTVGGMNTSIAGWGGEDVNLFEKVLRKRLDVLRAPDTSLSHRWHEKNCPKSLSGKQLQHCFGSRGEHLADRIQLANYIYEKGIHLNHSTSLPNYSPQLVVDGNEGEKSLMPL